jgi:hypothetical protein
VLTRRHIRRSLAWTGVGIGIVGLVGYILSAIAPIEHTWSGDRFFVAGRGGLAMYWVVHGPRDWNGTIRGVDRIHWVWLPRYLVENSAVSNHLVGRMIVPYWVLIFLGAVAAYRILPAGYPRGRCKTCGYDLRDIPRTANPVRCPECGEEQG